MVRFHFYPAVRIFLRTVIFYIRSSSLSPPWQLRLQLPPTNLPTTSSSLLVQTISVYPLFLYLQIREMCSNVFILNSIRPFSPVSLPNHRERADTPPLTVICSEKVASSLCCTCMLTIQIFMTRTFILTSHSAVHQLLNQQSKRPLSNGDTAPLWPNTDLAEQSCPLLHLLSRSFDNL